MDHVTAAQLDALRPALKQRWAARLRLAPALPRGAGLATPAMLTLLVDQTLRELGAAVDGTGAKPPAISEFARPVAPRAASQCDRHLWVAYYLAGAWTLRDVLPRDWGHARRGVVRDLARLARARLKHSCQDCLHRSRGFCGTPPAR